MADEWNSERWGNAIELWLKGGEGRDPAPLEALLRDFERPIPDFARDLLADLVTGKVKRAGRPIKYSGKVEREIAAEVFAERERLEAKGANAMPEAEAYRLIAIRRRETFDAIRGVVERLRPAITYEIWQSWPPERKQTI